MAMVHCFSLSLPFLSLPPLAHNVSHVMEMASIPASKKKLSRKRWLGARFDWAATAAAFSLRQPERVGDRVRRRSGGRGGGGRERGRKRGGGNCCSSAHCTSLSYRRSTDQTRLGREGGGVATALRSYSPPFKCCQSSKYTSAKHEKGACPADLLYSEATIYIYICTKNRENAYSLERGTTKRKEGTPHRGKIWHPASAAAAEQSRWGRHTGLRQCALARATAAHVRKHSVERMRSTKAGKYSKVYEPKRKYREKRETVGECTPRWITV